ncbi:MAG: TIGR02281 family clan AA aspartic protease [Pseudomonadales bacterium]|nr:TIGR02281 family clan AA aspartic protease [Pseudomonadales bacterium]
MNQSPPQPGKKTGKIMLIFAWVIGLALLTQFFGDWQAEQENPNQAVLSGLSADGYQELKLLRNRNGHYVVNGKINGQTVKFLLDTGATDVVIPENIAHKLGLEFGYPRQANTANGVITTYSTLIRSLQLDKIELHDVRGSINPHMDMGAILLGMSALKQLELIQRDQHLTLRQYANPPN